MDAQIENQDHDVDFVAAAVRIARTIDGFEERGEVLLFAANIYAEAGQRDLAGDLAQTIDESYPRDLALTSVAAACAAAGEGDQAESLLEMIEDEAAYGLAIERIGAAFARSGEISKAVEIAGQASDSASALSSIAFACPSKDLLADCVEIARAIDYPELKVITLVELAVKARTMAGQFELAELINEAELAAEKIEIPQQRIEARVAIAGWYKDNAQSDQAAEVLSKTRRDCKETERLERDVALEQIAAAYAGLRDFNSAEQLLERVEDPFQFSYGTAALAFENYQAGDEPAAIKLLAEGLEVVKDEPVYGQDTLTRREGVLEKLAQTYARIGHVEDALQVTELLTSQEHRDAVLRQIAVISMTTDNPGIAFKVFEKIEDDFIRGLSEIDVVRALTQPDQAALADHILAQASADVVKIESPYQRTVGLAELAQAYELREQTGRASENLFEALKTAATIKGSYLQARALLVLAIKHKELQRLPSEPEQQILEEIVYQLD